MLDYLAKNSFRQSQALQEIKTEVQIIKDSQKELRDLIEQLQTKENLNIDQYKVYIIIIIIIINNNYN